MLPGFRKHDRLCCMITVFLQYSNSLLISDKVLYPFFIYVIMKSVNLCGSRIFCEDLFWYITQMDSHFCACFLMSWPVWDSAFRMSIIFTFFSDNRLQVSYLGLQQQYFLGFLLGGLELM